MEPNCCKKLIYRQEYWYDEGGGSNKSYQCLIRSGHMQRWRTLLFNTNCVTWALKEKKIRSEVNRLFQSLLKPVGEITAAAKQLWLVYKYSIIKIIIWTHFAGSVGTRTLEQKLDIYTLYLGWSTTQHSSWLKANQKHMTHFVRFHSKKQNVDQKCNIIIISS